MADKIPNPEVVDFIKTSSQEHLTSSPADDLAPVAPGQHLPSSATTSAPAVASVALESPAPSPSTSAASASPQSRPLAYFTTPAKEVTKKQSVYLPVELHRALATVVNLPGVEVSLTDLLANIVQAWRDDHRAEVRKRYISPAIYFINYLLPIIYSLKMRASYWLLELCCFCFGLRRFVSELSTF